MKSFGVVVMLMLVVLLSFDHDLIPRELAVVAFNTTNNNNNDRKEQKMSLVKMSLSLLPEVKSTRLKKKHRPNCCKRQDFKCTSKNEGQLRLMSGDIQVCKFGLWVVIDHKHVFPKEGKLPISCLDAKFKGHSTGNGLYWINPSGVNDLRNAFLVYCDMSTAGGGWLLVAKITHDFAWICPDQKGYSCLHSRVDPLRGNLFHSVHERDLVDLSITGDENSGIHLNISKIRKLFLGGQQSVRFTFVTDDTGWHASEDAYAAFDKRRPNKLFVDGSWVKYTTAKHDYTWNVIKHERSHLKFTGSILCWGSNVNSSYRFYDHGLHAGSPSLGNKRCHLANDEKEIMLKSHYAVIDSTGRNARWDPAQFGFLNSSYRLQVPCKRIALWVR